MLPKLLTLAMLAHVMAKTLWMFFKDSV